MVTSVEITRERRSGIVAIIPARMGSSRFPGKPLATILDKPMIEHVYLRTAACKMLAAAYVATCDKEIYEAVERFGGNAIMTSDKHERASDRVEEAVRKLNADIVVMVQGDEPMIVPHMIELALEPFLREKEVMCSNLITRIRSLEELLDPNTIKVVRNRNGDALYFSREPIPTRQLLGFGNIPVFKQVCVIPFRREFLTVYSQLEPSALEVAESVDMLRILEHGYRVRLVESPYDTCAIDTVSDLAKVERIMRNSTFSYH